MRTQHRLTMSESASRFESIFSSALDAYKRRTSQDLVSHPLLPRLQSCDTPDAIITLLREQIPASTQPQSSGDRFSTCLIPIVNVLYVFSATLGEGVGLVNVTAFLLWDLGSDVSSSLRFSHPQKFSLRESAFSFWSVSSVISFPQLS